MTGSEPVRWAADDLALWTTGLPDIEFAILPPGSDRPNPRLSGEFLFVATFAPAVVYALESSTGRIRWRRDLHGLGDSSLDISGNLVLAKTASTLHALDAASGETHWEFTPGGESAEMLYSQPTVDGDRLFIGDRLGWLYCLDLETGQVIWKQLTNDANLDVNATAVVTQGLVITATNARQAMAYAVQDGREVWRTVLDGASIQHLLSQAADSWLPPARYTCWSHRAGRSKAGCNGLDRG